MPSEQGTSQRRGRVRACAAVHGPRARRACRKCAPGARARVGARRAPQVRPLRGHVARSTGRVTSRCDPRGSARVRGAAHAGAVEVTNLTPSRRARAPAVGAVPPLARPPVDLGTRAAARCGICPPAPAACPYCSGRYANNLARWVGLHLADWYPLRANGEAPQRRTSKQWGPKPNARRRRLRQRCRRRRARAPPRGARRPRASPQPPHALAQRQRARHRAQPRSRRSPLLQSARRQPPRSRGARCSRSSSRGSSCPRTSIR